MNAREMLDELLSNQLEVVLIPAPDARHSTHFVRGVQSQNCDWYRKFCGQYLSARKDQNAKGRTLIKRKATIIALERIAAAESAAKPVKGKGAVTKLKATAYVERLLKFIEFEKKQKEKQETVYEWDSGFPF